MSYNPQNPNGQNTMANSSPVVIASNQSAVGVSAASLPLPTGAATAAKQPALGTAGSAASDVITIQGISSMVPIKVDGSGVTQPVSGTVAATQSGPWNITNISGTVSLPTGASTAAKQPALGTAGSASADVITIQGISSMTPIKVDGSGVTQPVSLTSTTITGTVAVTESGTWTVATNADAAIGAGTAPIKSLVGGAVYNSTEISPTTGQTFALQGDSKGRLRNVLMDAAGNTRGANVTASNELLVNVNNSPSVTISVGATSSNQTNASQKTQIVDASGNTITDNSTTTTSTFGLDTNIRSVLGTAPSTAGKLDVKGADGDVFVRQATASNLNATVVGTGTFATQAAQSGTWNITNLTNVTGTVSLPTGAATAAKQPALGTAGSASADVITIQGISSMTPIKIDGSGVTQPVSGTVTANIGTTNGLALDTSVNGILAAQGSTTSGQSGPLAQTATTINAPTYTTAKTNPLSSDTSGNLRVSLKDTPTNTNNLNVAVASALPAGTNLLGKTGIDQTTPGTTNAISIAQVGSTNTVTGGVNGSLSVGGPTASGASIAANPVTVGSRAMVGSTLPTAVTDGQVVNQMTDKFGRQVVIPNAIRDIVLPIAQVTMTTTSEATMISAGGSGVFNDIISLVVINTSATATQVDFRDDTIANSGTIRLSLYVPAGDTRGISLSTPLPQAVANKNWTVKCGTAVSSVIVSGTYIANK